MRTLPRVETLRTFEVGLFGLSIGLESEVCQRKGGTEAAALLACIMALAPPPAQRKQLLDR